VHAMMVSTPAMFCANVPESRPNRTILESAGRRRKQLGGWFNVILKAG
jgi:hypothetical protein